MKTVLKLGLALFAATLLIGQLVLLVTAAPALWGITQIRKKGLRDWGGTLAAEQAHHIAVGAETLALRMERICANAQALAEWLLDQPQVHAVHYPGLAGHPQHELAGELFRAYGGLLSFELAEGIDPGRYADLSGRTLDPGRIAVLREEGAIVVDADGRLRVTKDGFPVLDAVVADLAA